MGLQNNEIKEKFLCSTTFFRKQLYGHARTLNFKILKKKKIIK